MSAGETGPEQVVEQVVDVGEFKIAVATAGAGPVVVMLHGEEGRPSWKDWKALLPLAEGRRLVIPDLVGFGGSSKPGETPDYKTQAGVVHDLMDVMKIPSATLVGHSWGGQVALEVAIEWPEKVDGLILVASTYDKAQLPRLSGIGKPSLIVWAEDDLVTQLKGGYLLRDALRTSRLEVLPPVAKDPKHDFTYAHKLLLSRGEEIAKLARSFLASPSGSTAEPPELENELRGMALKKEKPS